MESATYENHPFWTDFEQLKESFQEVPTHELSSRAAQVDGIGAGIGVIERYSPEDYTEALLGLLRVSLTRPFRPRERPLG